MSTTTAVVLCVVVPLLLGGFLNYFAHKSWILYLPLIGGLLLLGYLGHLAIRSYAYPPNELDNRNQTELGQKRPYVWVKSFQSYFDDPDSLARGNVLRIDFENASDMPAFNTTMHSNLVVVEKLWSEAPPLVPAKTTPVFLPAKGVISQILPDENSASLPQEFIPGIREGKLFVYVLGTVRYEDSNKNPYTCDFCVFYNRKKKMFVVTPFHNTRD